MTLTEKNKENVVWYVLGDVEGVIAWRDSEKFRSLKPVDECCDMGFFALADIDFTLEPSDVCCEYAASYGAATAKGSEIVNEMVMNIEYEQNLIYQFVDKEYYENDLYERELLRYTDSYDEWKSERTSFVNAYGDHDYTREDAEKEWNEIVGHYAGMNHFCEPADFDSVWEEVEMRRDMRGE